jgi:hypothetical protein
MPIKQVKYVFKTDISKIDIKGKRITSLFLFVMDRIDTIQKGEKM